MKAKLVAAIVAGLLISATAGLLTNHVAGAAEEEVKGSVLVETQPAKLGTIADTLTAYGTAAPAINGGMTLSVQAEGRVMHIAVTPGEAVHKGQTLMEFQLSAAASSTYQQAVTALNARTGAPGTTTPISPSKTVDGSSATSCSSLNCRHRSKARGRKFQARLSGERVWFHGGSCNG